MGTITTPPSVALFLGITYKNEEDHAVALATFESEFGTHNRVFGPVNFSERTDYYDGEMGGSLKKSFYTFPGDLDRERLSAIKIRTNEIEASLGLTPGRKVNLDPGYITNDKIVLATTKDFFHRIAIGQGIFAEVTLHFRHGKYRFFSWTYPDYKLDGVLKLLTAARADLVGKSRKSNKVAEEPNQG